MVLEDVLKKLKKIGESSTTTEPQTFECSLCEDRGYLIWRTETGEVMSRECACSVRKRNLRRLERSGLQPLVGAYTMERFQTAEPWQEKAKRGALDYLEHGEEHWFFLYGPPGTGKTHLCTAMLLPIMNAGQNVRYFLWREEAPRLKALVNKREAYDPQVQELKDVDVLYIDDFFKGGVTDGDLNFAFELLNSRYNSRKRTVISSELGIQNILNLDEALGSRIYERSRGYCFQSGGKNWRLRA